MAEIKISTDGFTLNSTWSCRTVYTYSSYGAFLSSTCTQSGLTPATKTVTFDASGLPSGATVLSAKVHASYTTGLYGGTFRINNTALDDDGFVTLDSPDLSTGSIDIQFKWTANVDPTGSDAHSSEYPTYNGSSSQSVTKSHSSPSTVSDVYLLIEYELQGLIYRAVSGVLVPYQIYHAENGSLVPYQLFRVIDGKLVQY